MPLVLVAALLSPPSWAQSRGELLYITHCVACHRTQIHWRDKRQVVDWSSPVSYTHLDVYKRQPRAQIEIDAY